jgi:glycosyltransferase involved in cell wall biosynthesis
MAKVSIGIPVYNAEKYLAGCLQCYLDQTYADIEIIVSDNGSTDGTRAIYEDYASRDRRILYQRQEKNQGAGWNYNRVLELAGGAYFKWGAYDDRVSPGFVAAAVKALDERPKDILAYAITSIIDADGKETSRFPDPMRIVSDRPSRRLREYLYKVRLTNAIYGLIRTDVLRSTGGLGSYVSSDVVLLAELAVLGTFHELQDELFYRRIHDQAYASHKTWSQKAVWFNPQNAGKLVLPTWTHLGQYLATLRRCRIGFWEKIRCYAVWLRWERYESKDLLLEAKVALRVKLFGFPKEGF